MWDALGMSDESQGPSQVELCQLQTQAKGTQERKEHRVSFLENPEWKNQTSHEPGPRAKLPSLPEWCGPPHPTSACRVSVRTEDHACPLPHCRLGPRHL